MTKEELLQAWVERNGFNHFEFYVNAGGVAVYRIKTKRSGEDPRIPLLVKITDGNEVVKLAGGEALDAIEMKHRRFTR